MPFTRWLVSDRWERAGSRDGSRLGMVGFRVDSMVDLERLR
jgi:hypothetical protein